MQRTAMAMMAAGVATAWMTTGVLAQAGGTPAPAAPAGGHAHDGHSRGMAYAEPATYAQALRLIGSRIELVQGVADAGKWDEAHGDLDAITAAGKVIGKLALAKDSGVARPAVKEVNVGGKAIAEAAAAAHDALNAGNKDAAAKSFERVKAVFAEISKAAPAAYGLSVTPAAQINAGEPTTFTVVLRDPTGATVQGLDVVHEQPMHLIVASRDLSWYRHEHPTRAADGTFSMALTLPQPGEYSVFADFTPSPAAGGAPIGNQVASAVVTVAGSPPVVGPQLEIDAAEVKHAGGLDVRIRCNGGYKAREDTVVRYNFQAGDRDVTDFEPYLGAAAHLVILSADGKRYVHAHPAVKGEAGADELFAKAASYGNGKDTDLVFHTALPLSGVYKAFLEFKRGGEVHMVPFTIEALALEAEHDHDERTEAPHPTRGAMLAPAPKKP